MSPVDLMDPRQNFIDHSLRSNTSSTHSDDDPGSDRNSNGTQIHHRSAAEPPTSSVSVEQFQDHDLPPQRQISSESEVEIHLPSEYVNGYLNLHMPQDAEEARARRETVRNRIDVLRESLRNSVAQESNPTYMQRVLAAGNAFNVNLEPLGRASTVPISCTEIEDFGPRPPTPPRRRPPLAGLHSDASRRSPQSQVTFSADDATLNNDISGHVESPSPSSSMAERPVNEVEDYMNRLTANLEVMAERVSIAGSRTSSSLWRTHGGSYELPRALRRPSGFYMIERDVDSTSNESRISTTLVSSTGTPDESGDQAAGFLNGRYVTTLERPEVEQRKPKESIFKRIANFFRNVCRK